jgi:hypothetical protein
MMLTGPAWAQLASEGAVFVFKFRLEAPPAPGWLPLAVDRVLPVKVRGMVLKTREKMRTRPARMAGMQAQKMAMVV